MIKEVTVSIDKLCKEPYRKILCYPRGDSHRCYRRIIGLSRMNITRIEFTGNCIIGELSVLGKGCVGIVVKANQNSEVRALKIRRLDADRESLVDEAEILRKVNELGIGPKVYSYTKDFILMEYIEGELIGKWIEKGGYTKSELKRVLKGIAEQCFLLDNNRIDHGELSNASKHIIISGSNPIILDFESASINRKPSNLPKVLNFLIFKRKPFSSLKKILKLKDIQRLSPLLRRYKECYDRKVFNQILRLIGL